MSRPAAADTQRRAGPGAAAATAVSAAVPLQAWLLGLLGVALFALTIPAMRLAVGPDTQPQLSAGFVAFGRAAVAGVLSALYLRLTAAARPQGGQWGRLAATAVGVVFGFPFFLGLALRQVDAAHAAVVTGVLPIATAALGALWLRQRPSAAFWACAALGLALVLGFAARRGGSALQLADGWLLLAVVAAAFGYVGGARLSAPAPGRAAMPPQDVISWVLVISLPVTLPVAWQQMPASAALGTIHTAAWVGFAYNAVFSMWLGFFAWYRALAVGGTVRISQVQLLQPFLAMWLGVPILGESLDAATVAFSLAVMATVFLSRRTDSDSRPIRPAPLTPLKEPT